MSRMTEAEFVKKYLTGKTFGWEDLVLDMLDKEINDNLEFGPLRCALRTFISSHGTVYFMLKKLGYEAG